MSTENTTASEWLETAAICLGDSLDPEETNKEVAENIACAAELSRLLARFGSKRVLATIRDVTDYAVDLASNAVHDGDVPTTKETVEQLRDLAKPLAVASEKL